MSNIRWSTPGSEVGAGVSPSRLREACAIAAELGTQEKTPAALERDRAAFARLRATTEEFRPK